MTIALILFGPSKLPEIGKSIGRAINEFKSQANSLAKDADISDITDPKKNSTTGSSSTQSASSRDSQSSENTERTENVDRGRET